MAALTRPLTAGPPSSGAHLQLRTRPRSGLKTSLHHPLLPGMLRNEMPPFLWSCQPFVNGCRSTPALNAPLFLRILKMVVSVLSAYAPHSTPSPSSTPVRMSRDISFVFCQGMGRNCWQCRALAARSTSLHLGSAGQSGSIVEDLLPDKIPRFF